ncbi:hypothetical protein DW886_16205 [Enterocloster aldenensis]|uniref:hypothetical protein n=1 Tax=Enterocloster aldenensis TaxID=358742 RepID=UPI000E4FB7AD|nr:hypothetical protein DW886_16205 [Enterocloster aldenensis]
MRKYLYIVGFVIILITIGTISYLLYNQSKKSEKPEYANHPAELIGTFVHIETEQSRNKYFILVDSENKIQVMKMHLDDVVIENADKKEIHLSDIHTGDTIKVNFLGYIISSYPELITKIQSVTLLKQNSDVDIDSLIKLVPDS